MATQWTAQFIWTCGSEKYPPAVQTLSHGHSISMSHFVMNVSIVFVINIYKFYVYQQQNKME